MRHTNNSVANLQAANISANSFDNSSHVLSDVDEAIFVSSWTFQEIPPRPLFFRRDQSASKNFEQDPVRTY